MDNIKNDPYYVEKIRTDLGFIVKQMRGVSLEDLATHEILQDSMLFRLIQISENAKRPWRLPDIHWPQTVDSAERTEIKRRSESRKTRSG